MTSEEEQNMLLTLEAQWYPLSGEYILVGFSEREQNKQISSLSRFTVI